MDNWTCSLLLLPSTRRVFYFISVSGKRSKFKVSTEDTSLLCHNKVEPWSLETVCISWEVKAGSPCVHMESTIPLGPECVQRMNTQYACCFLGDRVGKDVVKTDAEYYSMFFNMIL